MEATYRFSEWTEDAANEFLVLVVDDDPAVREAVSGLFASIGLRVVQHTTAEALLAAPMPDQPSCIVLDISLDGLSGLDLQARLREDGIETPIVFLSGVGDVPMTVAAMKAGAINFIAKPFRDQELIDAVFEALHLDVQRRAELERTAALRIGFASLTPRERDAMTLLARGLSNKQVADMLDISPATVKTYRAQTMKKMQARSFAELVTMARALGLVAAEAD
ncbi:response regulator transcription factor [Cupriavidus plantarum]|uniref:response regulator transcription factor n=1 Tax=Cupriavidus plantarum TaxID=942865 RepID=UPI000E277901|nr:response regulator [Cupriavidus plantarum]NYI01242.1 FixJ family two-component response regulator [Cupriavidus plantarum]REE94094.1 LuxR family two component transcriptional regulator [Cupriavidus plantarum]RLK39508.1 LuxR family two component transcriptional regulator [Cupriavidus plantarum]CAG2133397.1 Response regulator protein TodT [Cupriavidus plantarum]SMR84175.1 two component transcriptional regulator, LuxR family [Cupriavidus plantarum]